VAGAQVGDPVLDVVRQFLVGEGHVGPQGIATDRRTLDAAQHAAERRGLAPGGIGVPGVLVAIVGLIRRLVDAYQTGVLRIAAGHRMVLQLAEAAREGDVFGAADVLTSQEQYLVL